MAKDTSINADDLEERAFSLYAERIAKSPAQINGEQLALWAHKRAREFLDIAAKVRSGEASMSAPEGPQLCDASAPNLKPTHPHNLVSKRFAETNGGEEKVLNRIKSITAWLDKHPRSDDNPVQYSELDWDVEQTNLARVLLPHYCKN